MRIYLILFLMLFLLITGCSQKPKKVIPKVVEEKNVTKIPEPPPKEETPRLGMFDLIYNDESLSDGIASKIVVVKSKRALVLLDEAQNIISRHRISLGKNSLGTKLKQGDYKTPEGTYRITIKRSDPKYYKEMLISYPNNEDRERSKALGFNPGGGVTIHAQVPWNWDGHGNDFTLSNDWTEGCISVTNEGMDMIWDNIGLGTTIEIKE